MNAPQIEPWEQGPPPDMFPPDANDTESGTHAIPRVLDRLPPHDMGAEGALLAGVMLSPLELAKIPYLKAEHFYSERHRRIFEATSELYAEGKEVDVVLVGSRLKASERIAQVGGMAYLTELLTEAPAIGKVEAYAKIVHEKWRVRQIIARCQLVAARGYVDYGSAEDFGRDAARALAEIVEDGAEQLQALEGEDIFADLPPIPWVCQPLRIAPGAPIMLAGYGYGGKTITSQAIALAIASGKPALGLFHVQRGKVVHFDYEQGNRVTRERYKRLARAMGVDEREVTARKALRVHVLPNIFLDSRGAEDIFARAVDGATYAVIDSLKASTPGTEENDSTARASLDMLNRISERTGCTFQVIHHARKPSNEPVAGGAHMQVRGSSSIFDAVSSLFVLEGTKGKPTKVTHSKDRILGHTLEDFFLAIRDVHNPQKLDSNDEADRKWGVSVNHLDIEQLAPKDDKAIAAFEALKERVHQAVKREPGISLRRVRILAGGRKEHIDEALLDLLDSKTISETGGPRGAREFRSASV